MIDSVVKEVFAKVSNGEKEYFMKKLFLSNWTIEYDFNKTKDFYKNFNYIIDDCNCYYCKNYFNYVDNLSNKILDFFNTLGLDIKKATEIYVLNNNNDGIILYGGFYHIVGNLLSNNDVWGNSIINEKELYIVDKDFKIGFTKKLSLVPKDFPKPVLQMEIITNIKWILEENYND